jgi:PPOX class probable F420-dependent enzyme
VSGAGPRSSDRAADVARTDHGDPQRVLLSLVAIFSDMDVNEARDMIRAQHHAVLATVRPDGEPQMSPVLTTLDSEGFAVISTRETAYKVHNLRRDPRAWLCVLPDSFFGRWIRIDGRAEIVSLPDAMDGLIAYYRSISGEHPDWDDYRRAMIRDQRCLIRIRLERAGPDREG